MRWLAILTAASLSAAIGGCGGTRGEPPKVTYRGDSGPNKVEDEGPWKEAEITLPPFPRDSDLIRFEPTGQTTNRFYVDGSSLTVDPDKVVRFAVVIRSPTEAGTASYAGVNCRTREWKEYAYARAEERRWEPTRDPQWRPIHDRRINNYQDTLATEFFCDNGGFSSGPAGSAKKIVHDLKYPEPAATRLPGRYN